MPHQHGLDSTSPLLLRAKLQVYLPPCEPELLLADVKGLQQEAAAKALVDDVYLGYLSMSELTATLQHLQHEVAPLAQAVRNSRWMCAPAAAWGTGSIRTDLVCWGTSVSGTVAVCKPTVCT